MKPKKIQTLIVLFALLVIGFLYQLPTSVIKTKKNQDEIQNAVSVASTLITTLSPNEKIFSNLLL